MDRRGENQRQSTSKLIAERAHQQLAEPETDCRSGQGQLYSGLGDLQIGLDGRERREVEVYGEWSESGQCPKNEDVDKSLPAGEGVAGMRAGGQDFLGVSDL